MQKTIVRGNDLQMETWFVTAAFDLTGNVSLRVAQYLKQDRPTKRHGWRIAERLNANREGDERLIPPVPFDLLLQALEELGEEVAIAIRRAVKDIRTI